VVFWQTGVGRVIAFEPEFFETKLFETKPLQQPSSSLPRGMLWQLHSSIAGIGGCLSAGRAQRLQSLVRRRARVLSQRRRGGPRRTARFLIKEMMKQHRGEQCYAGESGASKHSARPGVDTGLFGLGQLNMKMWSHDPFFPCDQWMMQSIRGGEYGLHEGDSIRRKKFPLSRAKMKLAVGNNSARAEVMELSCAVYPQDAAA
jgi:hypothetical protein